MRIKRIKKKINNNNNHRLKSVLSENAISYTIVSLRGVFCCTNNIGIVSCLISFCLTVVKLLLNQEFFSIHIGLGEITYVQQTHAQKYSSKFKLAALKIKDHHGKRGKLKARLC